VELLADPKNRTWKDIVLMPFVDEERLRKAVTQLDVSKLTAAEKVEKRET
jgi:5'-3' exonuclease